MPLFMSTNTYDDDEPTDKDRIRGLIGDTVTGQWVLSDQSILATIRDNPGNFWESAAQCALKCGRRAMSLWRSVAQGHRLKIEYADPARLMAEFRAMADEFRDKCAPAPGQPANPGALGGALDGPDYSPYGPCTGSTVDLTNKVSGFYVERDC
jgi:hypothetical protein